MARTTHPRPYPLQEALGRVSSVGHFTDDVWQKAHSAFALKATGLAGQFDYVFQLALIQCFVLMLRLSAVFL
jgi:hypothetical protein